jgi:hypothetical protein
MVDPSLAVAQQIDIGSALIHLTGLAGEDYE